MCFSFISKLQRQGGNSSPLQADQGHRGWCRSWGCGPRVPTRTPNVHHRRKFEKDSGESTRSEIKQFLWRLQVKARLFHKPLVAHCLHRLFGKLDLPRNSLMHLSGHWWVGFGDFQLKQCQYCWFEWFASHNRWNWVKCWMCLTDREIFLLKLRLTTATVKIVEFKSFGELRVLWCCRNALFVVICFVVSFRLRWGLIVTVRAGHDHTIAHGKLPVSSVSRGIVVFDNTGFGKFVDQTCSPLLTAVSPVRCLVVCINPRQYKLPTSLYISAHCIQSCVVFQIV